MFMSPNLWSCPLTTVLHKANTAHKHFESLEKFKCQQQTDT